MRPGLGIAAADQVVDFLGGFGPVDPGMFVFTDGIVIRLRFILDDARRVAGFDQLDRFADGLDAKREDLVEVKRAGGVVGFDGDGFLQ